MKPKSTQKRQETITALLFASPWFLGFCLFLLYPLVASLYYSFCDYSVLRPPLWVGLANFRELMGDEVFWITLKNTAFYAVIALPLGAVTAIGLALMLNAKIKGMTFYRTIFFLPSLVPLVSLAVLWLWLFNGEYGLINSALKGIGFHNPPNWLGDASWSKPAMIVMSIWGAGNAMVIYLAGLQDIPTQLYEAADLDGANWLQKTRNVTIPMLSPVIQFNVLMGIIGTLQIFAVPYVMFPGGAPARSTYFYTMYLYDNAFIYQKMGYACAMGWIMFGIILLITLTARKLSERYVHYGSA